MGPVAASGAETVARPPWYELAGVAELGVMSTRVVELPPPVTMMPFWAMAVMRMPLGS